MIMSKIIELAQRMALQAKNRRRINRIMKLYAYINEHEGETAYSLTKKFNWPLATIQDLIGELEKENLIKIMEEIENGRAKKKIYLKGLEDWTFDTFNEETLIDPGIMKLLQKAQEKNITVTIIRKDGTNYQIQPEKLIQQLRPLEH